MSSKIVFIFYSENTGSAVNAFEKRDIIWFSQREKEEKRIHFTKRKRGKENSFYKEKKRKREFILHREKEEKRIHFTKRKRE